MKKKLVIVRKSDGKRMEGLTRKRILEILYSNYSEAYVDYCDVFWDAMEKYGDLPLKEYKWTEWDKRRVKENPDAAMDIPRFYVEGFDTAMGYSYEQKARNEFYDKFVAADDDIVDFVNSTNELYRVEVVIE